MQPMPVINVVRVPESLTYVTTSLMYYWSGLTMSGRNHSIASISSCPLKQVASSIEYEWSSSEHLSRHVGWVTYCGGSEKSRFSFPCHW
ncbi:unnamed protein product [Macrosiphum euphorbiae]|uniref:Uncharacterized protein n=1 Tax=Macrosiphum euphorbiae TaxID=13131 RepID=A0AAV0XUX6_9HEMI|nr:unnamed protein product [Macrosiphum euphorbiae]